MKIICKIDSRLYLLPLVVIILISCGQIKQSDIETKRISLSFGDPQLDILVPHKDDNINSDSLLKLIFKHSEPYYLKNSIDSLVNLHGKPRYQNKSQLGVSMDSSLTLGYTDFRFTYWGNSVSNFDLAGIDLFDENTVLAGRITIGETTRKDITIGLGLPDFDHNDPGRALTKSGDTTAYGTSSGAGDTVTFIYYYYPDFGGEYSIGFSMTNDTLRKVSWDKNMY